MKNKNLHVLRKFLKGFEGSKPRYSATEDGSQEAISWSSKDKSFLYVFFSSENSTARIVGLSSHDSRVKCKIRGHITIDEVEK